MAKPEPAHELDALIAVAQQAEPPVLEALSARRMVRSALAVEAPERNSKARESAREREDALLAADYDAQNRLPPRAFRRRPRAFPLLAAAALLLCLGSYAWWRVEPGTRLAVSEHGLPLRASLKTGDSLVLAPASELQVLSERRALRRVRLERGSGLFDVAKRGLGEHFEVLTPHALIQVRGTVFSVQVSEDESVVRVHEGSVWVEGRELLPGAVWSSRGAQAAAQITAPRALEAYVQAALSARAEPAQATTSEATPLPPASPSELPEAAPLPSTPEIAPPPSTPEVAQLPSTPPRAEHSPKPRARERANEVRAASSDELREALQLGRTEHVIESARERASDDDAMLFLLADALRARGDLAEAAAHYERLAARDAGARAQAGFAAAQIALVSLRDPERSLQNLERFVLGPQEGPLVERALSLQVDALLALGRTPEARQVAQRYLSRQPSTEASERMRRLRDDSR